MKTTFTSPVTAAAVLVALASLTNYHEADAFTPKLMTTTRTIATRSTARGLVPSDPRDTDAVSSTDVSGKGSFFPFPMVSGDFDRMPSSPIDKWNPGADNGWPELLAPALYAVFTAALIVVIYDLRDVLVNISNIQPSPSIGFKALTLVTGALIWDNLVITLGSIFFRDIETNETKFNILKTVSWPRFTLHAVAVPLQCITVAEMGKFANVGFFQSDLVQVAIVVAAFALGIADRTDVVKHNGIKLTTWDESPPDALERDLVKFGYEEVKFTYVLPAIVLALSAVVVGLVARGGGSGSTEELAGWLIFAGASVLLGNALPQNLVTFTGNLGEVCMQIGFLEAARIVYN